MRLRDRRYSFTSLSAALIQRPHEHCICAFSDGTSFVSRSRPSYFHLVSDRCVFATQTLSTGYRRRAFQSQKKLTKKKRLNKEDVIISQFKQCRRCDNCDQNLETKFPNIHSLLIIDVTHKDGELKNVETLLWIKYRSTSTYLSTQKSFLTTRLEIRVEGVKIYSC